jgi:hypothetical protein
VHRRVVVGLAMASAIAAWWLARPDPEVPHALVSPAAAASPAKASPTRHELAFQIGGRGFLDGDDITITTFEGDRPRFEVGGTYMVRGTYRLASAAERSLAVYVTSGKLVGGGRLPANAVTVRRGEGEFALSFSLEAMGYPHVTFYSTKAPRTSVGGVYFGDGAHLLTSAPWYEHLEGLAELPHKDGNARNR